MYVFQSPPSFNDPASVWLPSSQDTVFPRLSTSALLLNKVAVLRTCRLRVFYNFRTVWWHPVQDESVPVLFGAAFIFVSQLKSSFWHQAWQVRQRHSDISDSALYQLSPEYLGDTYQNEPHGDAVAMTVASGLSSVGIACQLPKGESQSLTFFLPIIVLWHP